MTNKYSWDWEQRKSLDNQALIVYSTMMYKFILIF